jgi:pilus assembly protein CpaE
MVRRKKWNRRRGDTRLETETDYALIQDAELSEPRISGDADNLCDLPTFDLEDTHNTKSPTDDMTPTIAPTRPDTPRIFALVGATGGVGTTSIATQLAHELAIMASSHKTSRRRPTDPTVCLIDLDFEAGACAHHLDLLPSLTLEDLCGPPEQIDKAFTQALISTHECGISLLAAPNIIGANTRVNPQTVMAMLDAAAELYETVIIDLPRYHQPWTLSVMRAVDVLGLTCELTIPSLHAARQSLEKLSTLPQCDINANIILSKFERRSFKNTLRLTDAEKALGQPILTTLCLDPDTTREALNCGEPAGVIRPDSRFVKDVRKLAETLKTTRSKPLSKVA